jgi:cation:H+ antiporter
MSALLTLIIGLVILIVGGEVLVRGAVSIATKLGIPQLVIGLTVVSFGTSAPELLVSIQAALHGSPEIALGNVAGSNLVNISLILGFTILIFPIVVAKSTVRIHWPVLMIASLLMVGMLWNGEFSRLEGAMCLVFLTSYIVLLLHSARKSRVTESGEKPAGMKAYVIAVFMLIGGIVGLAFGADMTVEGASTIAKDFGVSQRVIGLTVIAFGTSLPELVASIMAALRKTPDISVGNLVGSNIFNILLILGATGLVRPIEVNFSEFSMDLWVMIGVTALLLPLMLMDRQMGRWQGAVLISAYAAYVYLVFLPAFW